ncbi:hypothetical protein N7478_012108 [Penicillium angulare]|uniref:uncharacterized protein n=1 Tax=Penicillium angulare TaxID=116970 RepID=UPI0025420C83|nr:uncharacterized protein N7478_012108 [Penicillium angulare]KAJ5260503.1 hypothetical protein N7478_012108 [Penicillium angulare]
MLSLKMLALVLPVLSGAYKLKACTDTACSEGCVDLSADDVTSATDCLDFGFTAKSIYWALTENTLDAWPYAGCAGGVGSENVWINDGNPDNALACQDLESSEQGSNGVRYYIVNNSAE